MANLLEMNGREIRYFRLTDNSYHDCWKTDDKLFLKIEKRNGEVTYVHDVYVVRVDKDGKELQRWNFRNLAGVEWLEAE
jgi:hypothetical protein